MPRLGKSTKILRAYDAFISSCKAIGYWLRVARIILGGVEDTVEKMSALPPPPKRGAPAPEADDEDPSTDEEPTGPDEEPTGSDNETDEE